MLFTYYPVNYLDNWPAIRGWTNKGRDWTTNPCCFPVWGQSLSQAAPEETTIRVLINFICNKLVHALSFPPCLQFQEKMMKIYSVKIFATIKMQVHNWIYFILTFLKEILYYILWGIAGLFFQGKMIPRSWLSVVRVCFLYVSCEHRNIYD